MPDHLEETVSELAELHRQHRERSSQSQQLTNLVTATLGRPSVIGLIVAAVMIWVFGNISAPSFHLRALEPLPFPELGLAFGFIAVVIALLILSTQRHGEELAERRSELTLQIALLSERKVTKLIALLEEQRTENPLLQTRKDPEAEEMAVPADTEDAINRIEAMRAAP